MTITKDDRAASVKESVEPEEWSTRVDLAACYRLVARYGMTDMIYNHISAHVPGHPDEFLINPYGFLYEEITASCLHKIDYEGRVLFQPDHPYGINQAGFVIHSAVHDARPEVNCVIHTHARASMAVSAMACGFLPLTQHAMRFYGQVSYHDYEGVALSLEERPRLVADLGTNNVMILRNHGLLICGTSIAQAFNTLYWVEMACKVQVDVMQSHTDIVMPPEEIRQLTAAQYDPDARRPYGELEWPTMLRMLARERSNYAGVTSFDLGKKTDVAADRLMTTR